MTENDKQQEALERLVDRVLGDQPSLDAPATLELRVMEEIELRARLPWWRQNFLRWPLAARAAFAVLSVGAIKALWDAVAWIAGRARGLSLADALAGPASLYEAGRDVVSSLSAAGAQVFGNIPSFWLYAGVFGAVALYGALFGLGAAAYRTLYK